jgi:hypothetical protein
MGIEEEVRDVIVGSEIDDDGREVWTATVYFGN